MISRTSEYTKFVCKLLHNRFENFAYPMDAVLEILKNVERAASARIASISMTKISRSLIPKTLPLPHQVPYFVLFGTAYSAW
jgi:hypothetical protein